jgi:hypothetical protein
VCRMGWRLRGVLAWSRLRNASLLAKEHTTVCLRSRGLTKSIPEKTETIRYVGDEDVI